METSIIGNKYVPYDNSYCTNIENGKESLIVPESKQYLMSDGTRIYNKTYHEGYHSCEPNAEFVITSDPYKYKVSIENRLVDFLFINVRSTITSKIYRTLYRPQYSELPMS